MAVWWLTALTKGNVKSGTSEIGYEFNGNPRKESWRHPVINYSGLSYTPKDFISFSTSALLVSEKVCEYFENICYESIELLDVPKIKNKKYCLVNVVNVIGNCVDINKSKIIKSKYGVPLYDDGVTFIENCIVGPKIFKIEECPSKIFITDEFKQMLEEKKFTGAKYFRSDVTLKDLFYGGEP